MFIRSFSALAIIVSLLTAVPTSQSPSPGRRAPAREPFKKADAAHSAASRIPVHVERAIDGAPLTFGIPFPKGALDSPDHVRVLTASGREVPAQVNEVATWAPADPSLKWVWVFFFATPESDYTIEYGPQVRPAPLTGPRIVTVNNQRPAGSADVNTGPLRFIVRKGDGGFVSRVELHPSERDDDEAVIAEEKSARGSFLDLVNDGGADASKAFVRRTLLEKGSGPLHAILRVEGEYRYAQPNHPAAPFVTRIHAYAGRTYLRVEHTFVYTGDPDKHEKKPGEHAHIATQTAQVLAEVPDEKGWTEPNDRVSAAGLTFDLRLTGARRARTTLRSGAWWSDGAARRIAAPVDGAPISVLQTGPKPNRIPPVPESTPTERLRGFDAQVLSGERVTDRAERAGGILDISDGARGVAIAMPRILEEYPKELRFDPADGRSTAFIWSPRVEPMSFARWSSDLDREEETISVENNAQGIAKTTEVVFDFHDAAVPEADLDRDLSYFLAPPVPHAEPAWYGRSGAFGLFAARSDVFPGFERALDDKFEWMLFNQRWMPWYGMWDYGDWKLYFDGRQWITWGNNEPAEDYICWLQFMRTGDPRLFDAAQANSRHSMDVDNLHWPADPIYVGDTNSSLDYFEFLRLPKGSKYVGIGARHAAQHWVRTLGAHVWVQGWLADYYLAADHRGLDVALETAEFHLRRIWGEHGLTGRRLYLALWNLVEVWDATKDERYKAEIDDLVERMLRLQDLDQGGSLTVERYGYADVYVTHGLWKYLDLTNDARVRAALAKHARRVRDNPPRNHLLESYLSSVNALTVGYRLTGEPSFLDEIRRRIAVLPMEPLARPPGDASWTQASLFDALEHASHLPDDPARRGGRAIWAATNGLRVFGWTHEYILPFALDVLEANAPHVTSDGRPRED